MYYKKLTRLKKEIIDIENVRKKKRWKPYQKVMIDFINGVTKKAEFEVDDNKIILFLGDERKGFKHILINHYDENDLTTMDIINLYYIFKRSIKLSNAGVSNTGLDVYRFLKNEDDFRLVLKPKDNNTWIVTFYRKS